MYSYKRPAPVVDSVLDLIGNTPLVQIRRVVSSSSATVWGKAEHLNPGGSIKDRICLSMIEAAEEQGHIKPGDALVEPTSGNTGIGLALVSAVKGYNLTLTMPESMSLERRALLKLLGAKIELTEPERVMDGAIARAHALVSENKAFMPSQFDNPANPQVHETHTAQEIIEAFKERGETPDAFIAAVGTGGTISGVGRALKRAYPECRIIAVEPEASPVLAGGQPGPSKIQGLNAGFIPKNYDATVIDELLHISDRDAYDMKNQLAKEEGLLVGISAGANVAAAKRIAEKLGPQAHVVTILCDTGERYFSLDQYFRE